MRRYGRVLDGGRCPRTVPLEESEDVVRILGVIVFMLALSSLTLPVQPVQATAANPELSKSYQSAEEEEKEEDEDEDEEPDCE
jgi:hypothetical protein